MARGINKVILVGNLGQDPEVRYLPSGGAVTNVTIATSESWKDKHTGQPVDRTEWHRVVFFNRLAEIASKYLRKGSQAYIEGKLQTRKWQDQSGQDRYTTEIVAGELQMLGNRTNNNAGGEPKPQRPNAPAPPQENQTMGAHKKGQQQAPAAAPNMNSFDDDIPF